MTISEHEVFAWLDAWAEAIRSRDFEKGRRMFAEDVLAFGTVAGVASGLDSLVTRQWQKIWSSTRGFRFGPPLLLATADGLAVVALEWHSEGLEGAEPYGRAGRATLTLRSNGSDLLCVHSHFSMLPGTPALTETHGT